MAVRAAAQSSSSSTFAGARFSAKSARRSARRAAVAAQAKVSPCLRRCLPLPASGVHDLQLLAVSFQCCMLGMVAT